MLISHQLRFVFVHNPKVAGTSVRTYLEGFCEQPLAYRGAGMLDGLLIDRSHLRPDQWPREIWDCYYAGYTFFGIVRRPRDRFFASISEFQFQHRDLLENTRLTIDELLANFLTPTSVATDWRFNHFSEQWKYFDIPGVKVLRFENLDSELPAFLATLGIDLPLPDGKLANSRPSYFRPRSLSAKLEELQRFLYTEDCRRYYPEDYQPIEFCDFTHAMRLECVHRFPDLAKANSDLLTRVEAAALERERYTSISLARELVNV